MIKIKKNILNLIEKVWEKYDNIICLIFSILVGLLHYFGFLINFRYVVTSVVNFASIVIGVTGVFLTLLITLKESLIFQRLKEFFPNLNRKLYLNLRSQIYFSLIVVVLSLFINALPVSPIKIAATFGVITWSYFFWRMTLGAFFTVKIITDLVLRDVDVSRRKPRQ